jgi:L-lactate dehydrogenase complex protein LldG
MKDDREMVFARIRDALAERPPAHRYPYTNDYRDVLPSVGDGMEEWIDSFARRSGQLNTEFIRCDESGFDATIRGLVSLHGWKNSAYHPGEWTRRVVDILGVEALEIRRDYDAQALEACDVGITGCDALVAETGSVLMTTLTAGGRALSILPPHHLVIAETSQVLRDLPAAMERVGGPEGVCRATLAMLHTGPSRTGDIERKIVLGAHGPKKMTVVLVESSA